jgi:hypothetical protein
MMEAVTLNDLLFIVSFLVTAGALLRVGYLLLRRRTQAARKTSIRLTVFVAIYGIALVVTSLVSPQQVVKLGEERCFDEWCITVAGASRVPAVGDVRAAGVFEVVTVRVTSHSRGRPQREKDVYTYLTDGAGRRFDVSPAGQSALERAGLAGMSVTSFVDPGSSFESRLAFDVPEDAKHIGFVKTSHAWFPALFIIGDSSSLFHRPTIVPLGPG